MYKQEWKKKNIQLLPIKTIIVSFLYIVLIFDASNCFGETRGDEFTLIKESDCKPVDKVIMKTLPEKWNKYECCIKRCDLKENESSMVKAIVISIWVADYYKRFPSQVAQTWENFPLPLILDNDFVPIGELPELYPLNDITSPNIYFGKWQAGLPTEIRIDVSNPAVEGDYFYPPLIWDKNSRLYKMKDEEVTYGRRR